MTFQLDRMDDTRAVAERLVAEGAAYEDEGAIRFRMPDEGVTAYDDVVLGRVEIPNAELEDLVLVRSDGRPTYNFASPLEDMWDGITHVIRGPDHISNTPKQINVLRAVGAEPPVYAHVPNVNGADGGKLSKRHGATSVEDFRQAGYVPEALLNFLALLGWAPDGETTIMSRDELVERFTLERVGSSPATFDYAKLDWMNGVYLRGLPAGEYADRVVAYLREQGNDWPEERVRAAAAIVQEKIGRLDEFAGFAGFLFQPVEPDPALLDERILCSAETALAEVDPWTAEAIEEALKKLCEELGEKPRTVYLPIRVAVTGSRVSPGPLREPRAPRQGRVARPHPRGRGGGCVSALADLVGVELGPTSWIEVPQQRIDTFAEATADPQWIHVDPERAADGPFGTTIAHGFLTLSLCVPMLYELFPPSDAVLVNYGVDRVRFPAAVPSGSRVRGRFRVLSVDESAGRERAKIEATVECEGVEKPVCVAELVVLTLP